VLEERRSVLLQHLSEPPARFDGSFVERRKTCGQLRCRCARGELHGPYAAVLRCVGGERVSEPVDRSELAAVREWAKADRLWRRQWRELQESEREVRRLLRELRRVAGAEGDAGR